MELRDQMVTALKDHARAHIEKHRMNAEIYLRNPVGVGEHSEVMEEIEKQLNYYIENREFRPEQTTVLWDADLKQTKTMRTKEFEADYRFISEPDLPLVNIKQVVENIEVDLSALPFAVESILIKGGVLPQDAKFFTADSLRSKTFVAINNVIKDPSFVAKTLVNNIGAEEYANIHSVAHLTEIFQLFKEEKITAVLIQNGCPVAAMLNV